MFLEILARMLLASPPAATLHVATPTATAPAAMTANEAVDKVQAFYAKINSVTAQFKQTVTNTTYGKSTDNQGMVWISKPGKMRWDYLTKKGDKVDLKKSFISNGNYLYVVEHDNKQVMKKSLKEDLMPVAVSFLTGKGDLKVEFTAELDKSGKYGGPGDIVLMLTPKAPSATYKNLVLVVAPTDFHVSQSIIIASSEEVNHFRFFAPDFEKPVDAAWFEFNEKSDKVKNYRIIDGDKMAGSGSAAKK